MDKKKHCLMHHQLNLNKLINSSKALRNRSRHLINRFEYEPETTIPPKPQSPYKELVKEKFKKKNFLYQIIAFKKFIK